MDCWPAGGRPVPPTPEGSARREPTPPSRGLRTARSGLGRASSVGPGDPSAHCPETAANRPRRGAVTPEATPFGAAVMCRRQPSAPPTDDREECPHGASGVACSSPYPRVGGGCIAWPTSVPPCIAGGRPPGEPRRRVRHAGFRSVTARIPLTSVEHEIVNDDIEKRHRRWPARSRIPRLAHRFRARLAAGGRGAVPPSPVATQDTPPTARTIRAGHSAAGRATTSRSRCGA